MCPASIFNGDAVKILKDKLRFKTTGEIGWDATNGCPSYPSDITGVTNQIGQETHVRVYNDTGTILTDGTAVYVEGVDVDGIHPAVMRAIASDYTRSRILGLVTADIAIGAHGIVTIDGIVNNQNTAAYAPGTVLKLSASVAGTYSATALIDGNFDTTVGIVVKQDATTGSILVYSSASDYTVETTQKTGWSNVYSPATIAFDDGTRTLTLTPVGTEFHFYEAGTKYSKTTDSFQIADTEGLHYLYYDAGVITDIINPTNAQVANVLQNFVTIAYIGWDAANNLNIFVGKELHDMQFPSLVHNYNHFAYGARYINGLGPNSIIAEGNGSLDSHAQFGLDAGAIADEDIFLPTSAVTSTAGLPIFYLEGTTATPLLRKTTQAGFAVKTTGTGRLAYNFLNAGNWTVAEVPNGNYVLCHAFCIHENDITKRPIAFMGQAQYSTVALARAGAQTEIAALVTTGIIPQEIKSIATFVFETRDSYANSVNARVREISTGVNFIDWRSINNTGGSSASGGSTTTVFSDNSFQIYDDLDATKTFQAQLSSLTTGTNRIGTAPDRNFNMGNISSWVTSTHYLVTDVIKFTDERIYRCAIDHTSGTFATDLNAGNWVALSIDSSDGYNFLAGKIPTSFFAFDDGTAYVDGTGGSPSFISVAASPSPITNEPGRLNLRISKADAGSALGEGVSVDFLSRGTEDYGAMRVIRFKATTSANYIDNAFRFYFYDKTNNVIVNVSGDPDLKASSFVKNSSFEVQFPYSSDLRCSIYCNDSTVTTAYDIDCTWEIVETKQASGPVVSDWISYTPTPSSSTNLTVNEAKWRRVGGDIEIAGRLQWGGVGAGSPFELTIPSGLSIDPTRIPSDRLNFAWWRDNGTKERTLAAYNASTTTIGFLETETVANTWDGTQAASGDRVWYNYSAPIAGWSSNQVLSEDAGNRLIYTRATMSNQSISSSSATKIALSNIGSQDKDTVGAFDSVNNRINILETGFYSAHANIFLFNILNELVLLSIRKNGSLDLAEAGVGFGSLQGSIILSDCFYLTKGDYLEIFSNSSTDASYTVLAGSFTVTKISSSQQIAASAKVFASYKTDTGVPVANASGVTIPFEDKVVDSDNAYNISTGVYSCPKSGNLSMSVILQLASYSGWAAGEFAEIDVYIGATQLVLGISRMQSTLTYIMDISGKIESYPVNKGDLVTIKLYQNSGAAINLSASPFYNHFELMIS